MKIKTTERGFPIAEFEDYYGANCSIQKSSLIEPDCIWLGVNDADPKIMVSKAESHGLKPESENGWMKFPIPEDVLLNTRMHLTRDQVKELLPLLQRFVETGEIQ